MVFKGPPVNYFVLQSILHVKSSMDRDQLIAEAELEPKYGTTESCPAQALACEPRPSGRGRAYGRITVRQDLENLRGHLNAFRHHVLLPRPDVDWPWPRSL